MAFAPTRFPSAFNSRREHPTRTRARRTQAYARTASCQPQRACTSAFSSAEHAIEPSANFIFADAGRLTVSSPHA